MLMWLVPLAVVLLLEEEGEVWESLCWRGWPGSPKFQNDPNWSIFGLEMSHIDGVFVGDYDVCGDVFCRTTRGQISGTGAQPVLEPN